MLKYCLVFVGSFVISFNVFCFEKEELQRVADSRQWLKLLHYKSAFLGKYKSQQDSSDFFLSPDGKYSPLQELEANLNSMTGGGSASGDDHFQCRFPARYQFLKKKFSLKVQDVACPKLLDWVSSINAESLTLISASSYPQNPISTFGHTFLKINSKKNVKEGERQLDLLDYSVGFAAEAPSTISGFSYILKGVFGGFTGHYSVVPYYLKTKEYNNLESRDIWEYELNFTEEETAFALLHLWELGNHSRFDYYFFDENCSYQILTVLEVMRDSLELSTEFPVYTPPMETVKVINNKFFLVKAIKYRPSLYSKMMAAEKKLSSDEARELGKLRKDSKQISSSNNPRVLEALIAYYSYLKQKGSLAFNKDDDQSYYLALGKRSELEATESVPEINSDTGAPHLSHDTKLINGGIGFRDNRFYHDFKFAPAYHDLLSNSVGYPENSKFDILSFKMRYYYKEHEKKQDLLIQEITPLEIWTLLPLTEIDRSISWSGEIKYVRPIEDPMLKIGQFAGKVGISKMLQHDVLFYTLLGPEMQLNTGHGKSRLNMALLSGVKTQLTSKLNCQFNYVINYNLLNRSYDLYHLPSLRLSFNLNKNVETRLSTSYLYKTDHFGEADETSIELLKYF